jgi:hypothetical protein
MKETPVLFLVSVFCGSCAGQAYRSEKDLDAGPTLDFCDSGDEGTHETWVSDKALEDESLSDVEEEILPPSDYESLDENRLDIFSDFFFDEATSTDRFVDIETALEDGGTAEKMFVERKTSDVKQFGVAEYAVYLPIETENPFDPEEVEVKALVVGPSRTWEVFGFYFQDYDFVLNGENENAVMLGDPHFRVRIMPMEQGRHRVSFEAKVGDRRFVGNDDEFWAGPPANRGVVKVRPDKRYLIDAFGKNFVPVGPNIAWAGAKGVFDYERWFSRLEENGGNYARVWMAPFTGTGIEWQEGQGRGDFHGLGRYALQNARRLDRIMDLAQEAGIYVMLLLGFHGELTEGGYFNEGVWHSSPYNSANGGPCPDAQCFFQNDEAKGYYKRKLRYITARWGAYANIMAFELWNEVTQPKDWVREMAGYVKSQDPYGHMVSTTWFHTNLADCPELDFAQKHVYGYLDLFKDEAQHVVWEVQDMLANFDLPVFVGEVGIDFSKSDAEWDTNRLGVALHNEMFSAFSAGAMGPASSWWWDNYIDLFDLWHAYKPFVSIIERFSVPLGSQPISADKLSVWCDGSEDPGVRWLGVGTDQEMFVWVQNMESTWFNAYTGLWPPHEISGCNLVISLLPPAQYQVQWFETWNNGDLIQSDAIRVVEDDSTLRVSIPSFDTDIAAIITLAP